MKKVLFGLAFLGALLISSYCVQAEGEIMRWKQMNCTDGSGGTYEICWYTGDGNECDTYWERTRDCDPTTDPEDPSIG